MAEQDRVTDVWYTRCGFPTPVGIAIRLGLLQDAFAKEGISLHSVLDNPDKAIRASHYDHHLDWSFRQGGNIPPIWTRSEGIPTRLVGITWTDEYQAILSLPSSGIKTARDLAGRRFGLPRSGDGRVDVMAATALKGLVSALSLEGLNPRDVEIVDIPLKSNGFEAPDPARLHGLRSRQLYGPEAQALLRGDVDAIFVKSTAGIALANLFGLHAVADFGFHPDPKIRINSGSPRVLTVDHRLADERPDLVVTLVWTLRRAGDWARNNPDEVRRLVAQETGASEDAVVAAHLRDLHHQLDLGLDPALVDAVEHYKDFLLEWGFLTKDFAVGDWVDHRAWNALETRAAA